MAGAPFSAHTMPLRRRCRGAAADATRLLPQIGEWGARDDEVAHIFMPTMISTNGRPEHFR